MNYGINKSSNLLHIFINSAFRKLVISNYLSESVQQKWAELKTTKFKSEPELEPNF